jgi:hypothetical protein
LEWYHEGVPLGTRWWGWVVSVQRCFVPRTSTRLITRFAPLGAKMAEQASGLTRWWQAVVAQKIAPLQRGAHNLPLCGGWCGGTLFRRDAALGGWRERGDLWRRWFCRPCQRLPYLRRQGGLLPPRCGASGVLGTAKPAWGKPWWRKKLRHYSAGRTVPHTAVQRGAHSLRWSARCATRKGLVAWIWRCVRGLRTLG